MHLNLKAKGQFDMSNWLLPCIVLLHYKNNLKICARLFHLLMLKRIKQHNLSFDKQSTQSIDEKYGEKLTGA